MTKTGRNAEPFDFDFFFTAVLLKWAPIAGSGTAWLKGQPLRDLAAQKRHTHPKSRIIRVACLMVHANDLRASLEIQAVAEVAELALLSTSILSRVLGAAESAAQRAILAWVYVLPLAWM